MILKYFVMKDIAAFVSNTFLLIGIEPLAAKFLQAFVLSSGVEMEMVDLQNGIELKGRSRDGDFWRLVSKFPLLTPCALRVRAYFGSTYLCEMAFSQMKIIKPKYSDRHLTACL